jgi:site-specific recombinase XerC
MGKTPSMAHQVLWAVDSCFRENMDKHSLKISGNKQPHMIFSYTAKRNIKDTGVDLAKYCKQKFKIKRLDQIKHEHIQQWIDSKASSCTKATLEQYHARLRKLEEVVKFKYRNSDFHWQTSKIQKPTSYKHDQKIRILKFEKEDYERLMTFYEDPKNKRRTEAIKAIFLSFNYGLRADGSDTLQVRDIDFENMKFTVTEKGGKRRTLTIKSEHKKKFEEFIEGKKESDYIISIKNKSILKGVRNLIVSCGLGEKYPRYSGGLHSMRKSNATEMYYDLKKQGMCDRAAYDAVSKHLGHGKKRDKLLLDSYILKNQQK